MVFYIRYFDVYVHLLRGFGCIYFILSNIIPDFFSVRIKFQKTCNLQNSSTFNASRNIVSREFQFFTVLSESKMKLCGDLKWFFFLLRKMSSSTWEKKNLMHKFEIKLSDLNGSIYFMLTMQKCKKKIKMPYNIMYAKFWQNENAFT